MDSKKIGNTGTHYESDSASYSVTGPKQSDNWKGPISYNVYQDTVYGTFAFRDPSRSISTQLITAGKTSPIGVTFTGSTNFGTVTVGKVSAAITVTLTNNSPNQMTMVSPALSFSDLAVDPTGTTLVSSFAIVSGSDLCSNKVLAAGATCTLKIQFAPKLNAAPNTVQASYPVAAYVIAAGNETVPVADAGATAYNELVLVTNTVIRVSGTTETAVTVSGTAVPAPTTCTGILPSCNIGATLRPANPVSGQLNLFQFAKSNGTAQTETFTFTNYYSPSVSFSVYPADLALTDTTDFNVLNAGSTLDGCSGATVVHLGTCTFTLQFLPKTGASFATKITASGSVNFPAGASGTIPLAFAGAAGTEGSIGLGASGCEVDLPSGGKGRPTITCGSTTITNNFGSTLTVTGGTGTNGFRINVLACSTILAGQSCTATTSLTYSGQCSPSAGKSCSFSGTISVTGTPDGGPTPSGTTTMTAQVFQL
jgi:hypothetical protein